MVNTCLVSSRDKQDLRTIIIVQSDKGSKDLFIDRMKNNISHALEIISCGNLLRARVLIIASQIQLCVCVCASTVCFRSDKNKTVTQHSMILRVNLRNKSMNIYQLMHPSNCVFGIKRCSLNWLITGQCVNS